MKREIIKDIVEQVFVKAKAECAGDTKNALCNHISKSMDISYKTLERLYDKYFEDRGNVGKQSEHTINELCHYLNFDSYSDYVKHNRKSIDSKEWGKNTKLVVVTSLILIVALIFGLRENNNAGCMVWKIDHYEKADCAVSYKENVVPIDEVRLKQFKKVQVDLTTEFFDETTNEPLIWYYKRGKEIEYFTAPGLHPVNGKTLKAITEYMVNKSVPVHTFDAGSFTE